MKAAIFTDPHRGFDQNTSIILEKYLKNIDQSQFDMIIVSGDWGTSKINHVVQCFKMFRTIFPTKKIIGVLGNHDYWDKNIKSLGSKMRTIEEAAKNFDIHLLEKNPYETDKFTFLGFDGWYYYTHYGRNTNDFNYIEAYSMGDTDSFLSKKADEAVNFIIDYPKDKNKKIISVTHFPCFSQIMDIPEWNGNPRHGDILLEFSDRIIFGHSHKEEDTMIGKTRVINVGGTYNKLNYKIIDLDKL